MLYSTYDMALTELPTPTSAGQRPWRVILRVRGRHLLSLLVRCKEQRGTFCLEGILKACKRWTLKRNEMRVE
jgi:hypothetical protein